MRKRLHPTDWSRRAIIIGAFVAAVMSLILIGAVVIKLPPQEAMPWVILVFNSIWSLVIGAAGYYFGKIHGASETPSEPPSEDPPPPPRIAAR